MRTLHSSRKACPRTLVHRATAFGACGYATCACLARAVAEACDAGRKPPSRPDQSSRVGCEVAADGPLDFGQGELVLVVLVEGRIALKLARDGKAPCSRSQSRECLETARRSPGVMRHRVGPALLHDASRRPQPRARATRSGRQRSARLGAWRAARTGPATARQPASSSALWRAAGCASGRSAQGVSSMKASGGKVGEGKGVSP